MVFEYREEEDSEIDRVGRELAPVLVFNIERFWRRTTAGSQAIMVKIGQVVKG